MTHVAGRSKRDGRNPILVLIGKRLTQARLYIGLTQGDVAERLGKGEQAYRSYEAGRHPMNVLTLLRLPDVLYRPVEFFLGLQPDEGLNDEERTLVDLWRTIKTPAVREAVERVLVAQVAVDQQLRNAQTRGGVAPPAVNAAVQE